MTVYSRVSYRDEEQGVPTGLGPVVRALAGTDPSWWTIDVPAAVRARADLTELAGRLDRWREGRERVALVGRLTTCTQLQRVACSSGRAEGRALAALEELGFERCVLAAHKAEMLLGDLRQAERLVREIATPGWEIVDPVGAMRRDLVLVGTKTLCDVGPWRAVLDAQQGYALVHEDGETRGIAGERPVEEEARMCVRRLVDGTGALQVRRIGAHDVFAGVLGALLEQAERAVSLGRSLEIRRLGFRVDG